MSRRSAPRPRAPSRGSGAPLESSPSAEGALKIHEYQAKEILRRFGVATPRGRVTEIFGPESSGKTTLCQHVLAEAQRRGGVVAFIDVEHALGVEL